MSNLPGNPFAERAEKADYRSLTPATLALAYEQRTATLALVAASTAPDGAYALDPELVHAAQSKLAERLGLGGNQCLIPR